MHLSSQGGTSKKETSGFRMATQRLAEHLTCCATQCEGWVGVHSGTRWAFTNQELPHSWNTHPELCNLDTANLLPKPTCRWGRTPQGKLFQNQDKVRCVRWLGKIKQSPWKCPSDARATKCTQALRESCRVVAHSLWDGRLQSVCQPKDTIETAEWLVRFGGEKLQNPRIMCNKFHV